MALTLNDGIVLRNLEEQVQYLTDFHQVNQALAAWGIKILGQLDSADKLPDPLTYEGDYGDAYAIGTESPYSYYIWTRSSNPDLPAYWFDFGEIAIAGPQGPEGPEGPQGPRGESTTWRVLYGSPTVSNYNDGDLGLMVGSTIAPETIGNVYRFNKTTGQWTLLMNMRGPQGIQGPQGPQGIQGKAGAKGAKGDRGDTGGLVNIIGKLTNENQLPAPASLNNLSSAYLVNDNLYIQVGATPATAVWNNLGPLNVATLVTVNGQYQNTWSADTKVDTINYTGTSLLYSNDPNSPAYPIAADNTGSGIPNIPYSIPVYYNPNQPQTIEPPVCLVTGTPTENFHAATKAYVDAKVAAGGGSSGGGSTLYRNNISFLYTNAQGARRMYYIKTITSDNLESFGFGSLQTLIYYISSNSYGTTETVSTSDGDLGVCVFGTASGTNEMKMMFFGASSAELINTSTTIEQWNVDSIKM